MSASDDFSADERSALEAWPSPIAPADFVARTVARVERERPGRSGLSGFAAAAAIAFLMIGGFLTMRLLGGDDAQPRTSAAAFSGDAGPMPEVRPANDNQEI